MSTEAKWTFGIPIAVFAIGIVVLVFAHRITRSAKQRDEVWDRREQEQARTKGTVAVEDPTGGEES